MKRFVARRLEGGARTTWGSGAPHRPRPCRRLARDLALIPLTAVAVYLLVMNLPYRLDSDRKIMVPGADEHARMTAVLGRGTVGDALVPWRRLWAGESLAIRGERFTGSDFAQAVWTSVSLGLVALGLALAGALVFAMLRVLLARRPAGRLLEAIPAMVFGTPLFLLAVVVVLLAVAAGVPFDKSTVLAATCMAVAPGTFIGVVLSDALMAERARPYFITALAQGLSPRDALVRHALPNALPALLDAVAPVAASLLAGSFVCENFFQRKGFGLLYLDAARVADPGVVVIATTVFATLLVVVSLAVELLRLVVDPRARRAFEEGAP